MHLGIFCRILTLSLSLIFATASSDLIAHPFDTRAETSVNTPAEYRFGVLPFMSPIALFKHFSPLRDYINTRFNVEVVLHTARNMGDHQAHIRQRRYDFVFTAPHFVEAALQSGHYALIATHNRPLRAVVAVHKNNKNKNIRDFTTLTVATPPEMAIVSTIGKKLILDARKDIAGKVHFRAYASHNAAYHAVLAHEVDAAIIAIFVYRNAIMQHNASLHAVAVSREFPAVAILAASDLPTPIIDGFRSMLVDMHNEPEGQRVLEKMNFPGFRLAQAAEYKNLHLQLQQSNAAQACDLSRLQ